MKDGVFFVLKAVVFDVDDTLYDQQAPFKKAVYQICPLFQKEDMHQLYLQFRYYSDENFPKVMTGEWTLVEMRNYRIKQSLIDLDYPALTEEECLLFQKIYEHELDHIEMADEVKETLDYLKKKGVPLGIITNGPTDHQAKKIRQLQVADWVDLNHVIISQTTGYQKPETEIFDLASQKFGFKPEETLYVGDNFDSDVKGSKRSGWKALWFNHRQRTAPKTTDVHCDLEINSFPQFYETLTAIF